MGGRCTPGSPSMTRKCSLGRGMRRPTMPGGRGTRFRSRCARTPILAAGNWLSDRQAVVGYARSGVQRLLEFSSRDAMKRWGDLLPRALRRAGFSFLMVLVLGVAGECGGTAWGGTAPKPVSPRLYVLDCGTISPMDPGLFNLKASEVKGDVSFVSPCFLVVHPKGTLIWDVGQVPDKDIPDDGTEVVQQGILKAKHRLATQLLALGFRPQDITYMAMSHYHADPTANANMFARSSIWIV